MTTVPYLPTEEEIRLASKSVGQGLRETVLSLPTIHCGGCIQRIERALHEHAGVERARVNLSTKRVTIQWRERSTPSFMIKLRDLGYDSHLFETETDRKDPMLGELIRSLAVAGFASMNIMFLSVAVWSGAEPEIRNLFHWISALIALPTLLYSGRVYYRSAWTALRHFRTNMDVPVSIGLTLAYALSFYDTLYGYHHAYFEAVTMLLFVLLIGRTLDYMMRERARSAVRGLARLVPRGAWVRDDDGREHYMPIASIVPGMKVMVAAGERLPVDGQVIMGISDLDCSVVSGESTPRTADTGDQLSAGMLNLTAPIVVVATSTADNSFLAEMVRLMEIAESGRSGYRRLADRAARFYAPVVHTAAALSFAGWVAATGDWHQSLTIAIAVLIITCPCALALAVPIVQVVAARRFFENGIMVKDGSAMERLSEIDGVVFDKTGTLTLGRLHLRDADEITPDCLSMAAALAAHSRHPQSVAIAAAAKGERPLLNAIREPPGLGLEADKDGHTYRLGRAAWALGKDDETGTVLACDGVLLQRFYFDDRLRPAAFDVLNNLRNQGLTTEIISGDGVAPVQDVALALGVSTAHANMLPGEKLAYLEAKRAAGHKVLMVGDGLNDAPALAAASVSMAPANAADVGRNAADFVFLRDSLIAVPTALKISRDSRRLIGQNFTIAAIYNVIALPVAIAGYVTPLIAAIVMALSSLMVVTNALRLGYESNLGNLWSPKKHYADGPLGHRLKGTS